MDVLNNVLAPDRTATAASTIDQTVPHSRAILDVNNAAIYWQVKAGGERPQADWQPTNGVFMTPGSRRLPVAGKIYGVRFWAATPLASLPPGGTQARVTATLI